jgi:predicted homoserine dehydrogenase-like protein
VSGTLNKTRVGIVGSGFIAKGLVRILERQPDLAVSRVLTRTDGKNRSDFPRPELLTGSAGELADASDIVVVSTGDAVYGTAVTDELIRARLPVVTMDAELQLLSGSYFAQKGYFTEAEGDQPGCLAALKEDAEQMGFSPLVYGNIKGFLDHDPAPADMKYWAEKNGQRYDSTIAMTDGTKVQIEQAFAANAFGAGILEAGLSGTRGDDLPAAAFALAEKAVATGRPVSDYVLSPAHGGSVFLVCENDPAERDSLRYYKMGDGPFYLLQRNYHLSHLEITKTLRRAIRKEPVLMNNGPAPAISAAAVAKHGLSPGDRIEKGTGGPETRGIAVRIRDSPDHVPIGLLADAVVKKTIRPGEIVTFDDVDLPQTLALEIWRKIMSGRW